MVRYLDALRYNCNALKKRNFFCIIIKKNDIEVRNKTCPERFEPIGDREVEEITNDNNNILTTY